MLQQNWPERINLESVWHWSGVCRVAEPPEVEVAVLAHGRPWVSESLQKCQVTCTVLAGSTLRTVPASWQCISAGKRKHVKYWSVLTLTLSLRAVCIFVASERVLPLVLFCSGALSHHDGLRPRGHPRHHQLHCDGLFRSSGMRPFHLGTFFFPDSLGLLVHC